MSLADPDAPADELHISPVAAALQLQYHNHGLVGVGIQESRRPKFAKTASHYLMISGGCDTSSGASHGFEL